MRDLQWLTKRPIAHRGLHDGNQLIWENTLSAFTRAIAHNFTIECDVMLTRDHQIIVFHDQDLHRLTGTTGSVREYDGLHLCDMHIGNTHDKILSLNQMVQAINGKVPILIELKGDAGRDTHFINAVAKILKSYKGQIAIMSFEHHLLKDCMKLMPDYALGLTAQGVSAAEMSQHFKVLDYPIDFVSYHKDHLDNRFIKTIKHDLKLPVLTWTIQTKEDYHAAISRSDQVTFELINPDKITIS
jgi:glycerophosphoryl diester phosphodiesterase